MYIKEFDAVYFARSIRNLKMLVATLMDDSERFLSTYQQFNAISLVSESNSSNSSDDPYEKIPKLLASRNKRYKHEKWVDNFFEKYLQERFSPKDYRLMNCVCTTKELTNDQLVELEISKADSHISNPEEIEKKLKHDSINEESKKAEVDLNRLSDKTIAKTKKAFSSTTFNNHPTRSKTTFVRNHNTGKKSEEKKNNEDEVESLSMINELELPRISIGSKFSKNEFGQNKLEE